VIENIRKSSLGERERGHTTPSAPIPMMSPAQPQRCTDLRHQLCDPSGSGRGQVHHCHLHLLALPVRACPPSAKATKTRGKHKPQMFAEMGFYSAKAGDPHKDKGCVVM